MKTRKNLMSFLVAALLLAGATGCSDHDIPAANLSLSYPAGEMVLGAGSYTSARPTVQVSGTPEFSLISVTHEGEEADPSIALIEPTTGAITLTPGTDPSAVGTYLVSVRMRAGERTQDYPDALRVVVKGLLYEAAHVAATRGEECCFPLAQSHLVRTEGTRYSLVLPDDDSYAAFSIDPESGDITVSADAEAGIYPLTVRVVNATNPDGYDFEEALKVTVESRPYDLSYTPSSIVLIPLEGHASVRPAIRAATLEEGTAVTYSLLDDFGVFTIDASTGVISLEEDTPLVTQTAKTYALQVRATNGKGTASFPDAYTITVDPEKKADPITGIAYPDAFPVELTPGQAWTSERPSITGSTVGIEWSIADAPEGVEINKKTGVITLAEGHRMPLLTAGNFLTVRVQNQGMTEPYEQLLEFRIDPVLWAVQFTTNNKNNSTVNSGIGNMDRYSFSGYIQNNQSEANKNTPSTIQVRNGFGKASTNSVNGLPCIDAIGANTKNTWSDNTNINNDWIVSSEIEIPANSFNPSVAFNYASQFGQDANNILELYVVELNEANVYTKGEQNQDDRGLDATPSDLPWQLLSTTDASAADVRIIVKNHSTASSNNMNTFTLQEHRSPLSAFKGKKVRIALRYWNPTSDNNNSRTYRIESLRVEDSLE